jgi:hypothetical protein
MKQQGIDGVGEKVCSLINVKAKQQEELSAQ